MNERIKQLYTQVCMEQKLPFTVEHNSAVMLDAFANKFAELIVRECIEINKQELSFNAFERLMNKYKEHFGVEE